MALAAIEVPLDLALDAELSDQEELAHALLDDAGAVGDSYGVRVLQRLVRTRSFGRAIVDEAEGRHSEVLIVGADRRNTGGRRTVFSDTVDFALKHAPCRVMIAAAPPQAAGNGRTRDFVATGTWAEAPQTAEGSV